jgi:uncharacterized protein YdbL (DUF1318 family)
MKFVVDQVALRNLFESFPELHNENIIWQKEVFAHFGLIYHGFALLEHSLINAATLKIAIDAAQQRKLKSREEWLGLFDESYLKAVGQTFGNLIKIVVQIEEFKDLKTEFKKAKQVRDYFSHHFFRRETSFLNEDDGCLVLLVEMLEAKKLVDEIETATKPRYKKYTKRLGFPELTEATINSEAKSIHTKNIELIREGQVKTGLQHWINPKSEI